MFNEMASIVGFRWKRFTERQSEMKWTSLILRSFATKCTIFPNCELYFGGQRNAARNVLTVTMVQLLLSSGTLMLMHNIEFMFVFVYPLRLSENGNEVEKRSLSETEREREKGRTNRAMRNKIYVRSFRCNNNRK